MTQGGLPPGPHTLRQNVGLQLDGRGEIIRAFLQAPLSQSRFRSFFDLCHATTIGLLNYYKSRGYPVPVERADTQAALSDTAYSLLGEFFQATPDERFPLIFDYFARHGMDDFEAAPAEDLYDHFRILLSGYIKKQMFRQRRTEHPQAEILKRRIKDILQPPEYLRFRHNPSNHVMVALVDRAADLREEAAPLPYPVMADMVQQAYYDAHTRTAWCSAVFGRLDLDRGHRNFLPLNDVLLAMVQVNATVLEEVVAGPAKSIPPELGAALQAVDMVVCTTVAWTRESVVPRYVQRGRLTAAESEAYLRAVELYLLDLGYSGGTDPVPLYFREVMPKEAHAEYIKSYKYTFEAVMTSSTERFRELLARKIT